MKLFDTKLKKTILTIIITITIVVTLVIVFISPIAKYLVEKYDIKYTGREISMDYAYVNPFTGYIFMKNINIKELKSDSVFIFSKGISAQFNMFKLFNKTYEISHITLNQPIFVISQTNKNLNFDDIIKKFTPKKTSVKKTPLHFNMLNMKINDGIIYYRENTFPINLSVVKVNIESKGLKWDMDTLNAKVSLLSGNGPGGIDGNITINLKNLNYKLDAVINKLQLQFLEQYFKKMSNYGSFEAVLDANIKTTGNFKDAQNLNAKGIVTLHNFHFGETASNDFASFDKFILQVKDLNPKNKTYLLDSISLSKPYFKFERYDYLDNVQMMFGKKGTVVAGAANNAQEFNLILEIGNYIKALAKNFFKSNYKINRLAIYKGDFTYNDYTLNEKFSISASPIDIIADSIDKNNSRVKLFFNAGLKPFGNANVNLSINPKDSSDFDLNYNITKLPISLFNPYLIKYTSFPLDRGSIELKGTWHVKNGIINSNNHLLVIDPRVNKRIKNKNIKWIPLRLIMFFVRERGNIIDYEIPITGNLNKPNFVYRDVIFDALENIFVKPATTSYRTQVKNTEYEIEKSMSLKWDMRKSNLSSSQEHFLEDMADLLKEDPNLSISIDPMPYTEKEKEYILFFEAKKQYYLASQNRTAKSLCEDDTISIDKMSNKDSLFVKYLNTKLDKKLAFTVQDKCLNLLGNDFVNKKLNELNASRKDLVKSFFTDIEGKNRVKINSIKNNIPFNGFSYFKIDYKGEIPKSLEKAYERINELNNEPPRNKFKKVRDKNKQLN
ncbi:MAG: DUF748 domain-containing protein [Bacteroidetes bacterium]|nr:DUF748 domain-containing protein [Bacteroidota bacterium]